MLSQASLFLLKNQFSNFSQCQKTQITLPSDKNKTQNNESHVSLSRNFDASIAQILKTYNNTRPQDTRDRRGRTKFMAFSPEKYLIKGAISLFSIFWRNNIFHSPIGPNCCSPEAICFNGVSPSRMYLLDYLLYHAALFRNSPLGIGNHAATLPARSRDQNISEAMRNIEMGHD